MYTALPKRLSTRQEILRILWLSFPSMVTSFSTFGLELVQQIFVGRIGDDELSALGISNTWFNPSYCFVLGVSTALDTFASQAYGAKDIVAITQHTIESFIVLGILSMPLCVILFVAKPVARSLFSQNEHIANLVGTFSLGMLPGVLSLVGVIIMKVLMTQNKFVGVAIISFISFMLLFPIQLFFIRYMGFLGSSIGLSLTRLIWAAGLFVYWCSIQFKWWKHQNGNDRQCWDKGLAIIDKRVISEAKVQAFRLSNFFKFLKLGLAGGLMLATETTSFDISTVFASYLGTKIIDAHISVLTLSCVVYVTFPLSIATVATIIVGNYLGENKPFDAKRAGYICVVLASVPMLIFGIVAYIIRGHIGYVFTSDADITRLIATIVLPFAAYQLCDGIQGVSQGVLRGMGRQVQLLMFNLVGFVGLGVVSQVVLCFVLQKGLIGIWWGLFLGDSALALMTFVAVLFINWKLESEKVQEQYVRRDELYINGMEPLLTSGNTVDDFDFDTENFQLERNFGTQIVQNIVC